MKWMNPNEAPFKIYGLPFLKTNGNYRRLQNNPPAPLPDSVNVLADRCAGGQVRFRATLKEMHINVKLKKTFYKAHMPATAHSGFDCYVKRPGIDSDPIFFNVTNVPRDEIEYSAVLINTSEPQDFEITLNMPLYNVVSEFSLGFDDNAVISEAAPFTGGRIVSYGGSGDQGCCTSRPGMAYPSILSRWLNREFINLGFSGNGKVEEEVAKAIVEIDNVDMFIINADGNSPDAQWINDHLPRFIEVLRERYPTVPILIWQLSDFTKLMYSKSKHRVFEEKWAAEQLIYDTLRANGDENIYIEHMRYTPEFMGHNIEFEATVDGLHPTGYGFMEWAKQLYPIITEILAK